MGRDELHLFPQTMPPSKKRVEILLEELGYSVIDLGNLRDGGLIQQSGGPLAGRDLMERGEYRKKGDAS